MCPCICARMSACVHMCVRVCLCVHLCVHDLCVHLCACVYVYMCVCMRMCVHVCLCTCVCVCACAHMPVCVHVFSRASAHEFLWNEPIGAWQKGSPQPAKLRKSGPGGHAAGGGVVLLQPSNCLLTVINAELRLVGKYMP